MKELYDRIRSREQLPYERLKEGQRIAAILPSDELDIIRIERLGNVSFYDTLELVAVAKVCPGQASMRLRSDGTLYLNELVEVGWGLTRTGRHLAENPLNLDTISTLGILREIVYDELGPLKGHRKAHWSIVRLYPIVELIKSEMRQMQEQIEKRHPELK